MEPESIPGSGPRAGAFGDTVLYGRTAALAAARPDLVGGEAGDPDDDAAAIGRALQAELNNGRPPRAPRPVSARRIFMEDEAQEFGCASVAGCLPALVAIPLAVLVEVMWREYQWLKRRRAERRGHHNSG